MFTNQGAINEYISNISVGIAIKLEENFACLVPKFCNWHPLYVLVLLDMLIELIDRYKDLL